MTKERLRTYQAIKREAKQLQGQLEELEASMYGPKTQQLTGMPSGASADMGSTLERVVIKHTELVERYRAKLAELTAEQLEIEKAIESLDGTARVLMRHRYIEGLTWEEVCVRLNYSWRQTHRLHRRALEQLRSMEDEVQ